jgi:hypothetical protein
MKTIILIILSLGASFGFPKDKFKVLIIDTGINYTKDSKYFYSKKPLKYIPRKHLKESNKDKHSHGTQMTSIIADSSCRGVEIIPCNFRDNSEKKPRFSTAKHIQCLNLALTEKVDVVNISSYGKEYIIKEYLAIKAITKEGIKINAALGNEGKYVHLYEGIYNPKKLYSFPASYQTPNLTRLSSKVAPANDSDNSTYEPWSYTLDNGSVIGGTSVSTAIHTANMVKDFCKKNLTKTSK